MNMKYNQKSKGLKMIFYYDIGSYTLEDMLNCNYLIIKLANNSKFANPAERIQEAKGKIKEAYQTCESHRKPEPVKSHDHQPCTFCGSTEFQRTGTCFVCMNCQTSQGCS